MTNASGGRAASAASISPDEQHLIQRFVRPARELHALGQFDIDLFDPPRLIHPRLHPFDGREIDAILVLKETARIDRRRLRPFGNADAPSREICDRR